MPSFSTPIKCARYQLATYESKLQNGVIPLYRLFIDRLQRKLKHATPDFLTQMQHSDEISSSDTRTAGSSSTTTTTTAPNPPNQTSSGSSDILYVHIFRERVLDVMNHTPRSDITKVIDKHVPEFTDTVQCLLHTLLHSARLQADLCTPEQSYVHFWHAICHQVYQYPDIYFELDKRWSQYPQWKERACYELLIRCILKLYPTNQRFPSTYTAKCDICAKFLRHFVCVYSTPIQLLLQNPAITVESFVSTCCQSIPGFTTYTDNVIDLSCHLLQESYSDEMIRPQVKQDSYFKDLYLYLVSQLPPLTVMHHMCWYNMECSYKEVSQFSFLLHDLLVQFPMQYVSSAAAD